jgi:hypothetical protein
MKTEHTPTPWDLEEHPYETNDKAGGYYLHFDPNGDLGGDVLYMSKAHISESNAQFLIKAVNSYDANLARIAELEESVRQLLNQVTGPAQVYGNGIGE